MRLRSRDCGRSPSAKGWYSAAEELGKYKMIFQMFALHGLLLHYHFLGIDFHLAGMYFLWISLVISLWSGIDYHVKVIRQLMRRPQPSGRAAARTAHVSFRANLAPVRAACYVQSIPCATRTRP